MTRTLARIGFGAMVASSVVLASCSSTSTGGAASGQIAVVASTDVWGNIASAIGGSKVQVTSIVSDPSADPHSYEADVQNQLAISKATVIIENGGGYDDFVGKMVSSAGSKATIINAVDISGYAATQGDSLNEHVWYDFPTVDKVVDKIRTTLTGADPAGAATFDANAKTFTATVAVLRQKEAAIKTKSAGVGVAITEPVPLYMLDAAGLTNKTPPEFSEAIEGETDAPATVVAKTLALFTGKQVKALVYNEQTTGPQTEQVLAAAKANGIAIVPVTETLPGGTDYLGWMGANLDAIAKAVA
ncbi:zinc/manganese transport system substrate-binding protein [Nakamurella sp. UYEF19]|uniref:metal ABC transporter solute-binding protein, Zn/Mn family n=1 Tax=Nakamurella sp. UYEF19 TaxID=1756392 RepID=UPI003399AA11